jgi:hypothetical protein
MHSATTATGSPLPPPGKSLPKNRPAPPSCRAAHQLAAPKPHVTYVTSHRQCSIEAPASTPHSSRVTSHAKFNRQPRRLEFTLSHTKQTPAPQINRQQIATSKITHHIISNRQNQNAAPAPTRHSSLATRHCRSNRHTPRLENAISRRKQTLGASSNRHSLHVSASHQLQTANAHRPTHKASNRQWQILENNVNLSKQTTAPRSNRHKNAIFVSRFPRGSRRGPKGMGRGPRLANHGSCLNQTPSAAHSAPPPLAPPQCPPVRNSRRAPAPRPTRATSPAAPRASKHPQSRPETSFAAHTQSSHSQPDNHPAPATPRRTVRFLPPTKPPRNCATPAFPAPASAPTAPNPPDARGSAPASASFLPRETPQTPPAHRAKSSLRDRPR